MRRSRSVLVVSMTVFLVMAMATFGICGPPPAGNAAGQGPGGQGPGGPMVGPGGETGGQASAASGLEITPGVGSGTPGGDGSGSPALLLSAIGTKSTLISVQRAAYTFPLPRVNSGIRIVGDLVNSSESVSGKYGNSGSGADVRLGHQLDVKWVTGVYSVQAQLDYRPITGMKGLRAGPSLGWQMYSDYFQVTDNTNSTLSSDASHSANFITLGGWAELGLPSVMGSGRSGASSFLPTIYLAAAGGVSKNWNSFNWEATLSLFQVPSGSIGRDTRWGKYMPAVQANIGYIAYYFTESNHDTVPSRYLVPGQPGNALNEDIKANFGAFVVRGNLTF